MNKHSAPFSQDKIDEVSRLIEIVGQRKTVEVHTRNTQELDAMGPIEALLGVHQTPTFQIALSGVENCCDSHLLENPARLELAVSLRSGSLTASPGTEGCALVPEINARVDQVRPTGRPPPLPPLVPAEVYQVPRAGGVAQSGLVVGWPRLPGLLLTFFTTLHTVLQHPHVLTSSAYWPSL